MADRPRVQSAPGLVWKPRVNGSEARWQARTDLVKRGYTPKSVRLWCGSEPSTAEWAWIVDRCKRLQSEMLIWARGGLPVGSPVYDGTMRALIRAYQTDKDSTYQKLRYKSRVHYDYLCANIEERYGDERLQDLKARSFLRWHEDWSSDGKVAMGHAMMTMVRTIITFGTTILEEPECERLSGVLHKMRFSIASPRNERLTAAQATAIRAKAHELGLHSIALAQAFQFELMLRQKDVIGEWVPVSEPGTSGTLDGKGQKWLRGIRWSEIDSNLILRHTTSKRLKDIEVDLKLAPMVLEELALIGTRSTENAPIVVAEHSGIPWRGVEFRRHWRRIADACGIPKSVKNMDSRAGAISEATDAGADLEHVRHAATHSNISMTQRYSRGGVEKAAKVMQLRAAHRRNASGTE